VGITWPMADELDDAAAMNGKRAIRRT